MQPLTLQLPDVLSNTKKIFFKNPSKDSLLTKDNLYDLPAQPIGVKHTNVKLIALPKGREASQR